MVVVGVLGGALQIAAAEVARVTMGNRGAGLVAMERWFSIYGYLSAKMLGMPAYIRLARCDLPAYWRGEPAVSHAVVFDSVLLGGVWGLAIVGALPGT